MRISNFIVGHADPSVPTRSADSINHRICTHLVVPAPARWGSEAEGAVVNDRQVYCQSRDLTEPQRDQRALRDGADLKQTDKSEFVILLFN